MVAADLTRCRAVARIQVRIADQLGYLAGELAVGYAYPLY